MKERIIHFLLMGAVLLALGIALSEKQPVTAQMALSAAVQETIAPAPTLHPAQAFREERKERRSEETALLSALLSSAETDPELRSLAEQELQEIISRDELELAAEAALAGYGDEWGICVAQGEGITIFLSRPLSEQQAALILELMQDISGVNPENIRITGC